MRDEFSVCQFFKDDGHEYVKRYVDAKEALDAFRHYTRSVAAQIGIVERVIITDGDDFTVLEWQYGKGLTFPPELIEKWNRVSL